MLQLACDLPAMAHNFYSPSGPGWLGGCQPSEEWPRGFTHFGPPHVGTWTGASAPVLKQNASQRRTPVEVLAEQYVGDSENRGL